MKSLYLTIHNPDLEPAPSASQQTLFDQGHEVGTRAQQEFPGGVLIEVPYYDTDGAIKQTEAAIKGGAQVVYEATFVNDGLSARIDILTKAPREGSWNIIEVKSSTSVKPEHLDDVAIQVHVAEAAGLKIEKASVMHLNNQSTAPALKDLFNLQDVTSMIGPNKKDLPKHISSLRNALTQGEPPKLEIGPHCHEPYECPFVKECWSHVPSPSIFDFPGLGAKAWDFYAKGIVKLDDPKFGPFTGSKAHRLNAARTGRRWTDTDGIVEGFDGWKWPLLHLDFETIAFAIPRYPGTRPYEQVPFQFSAMIQKEKCGPVEHVEFLHDQRTDPRPRLLAALVKVLSNQGSIVAYNKGFESSRLKAMANAFPEHADTLLAACDRLVDPLPIFRNSVYDPAFKDSFSIKSVAPAILGPAASYHGLTVPDGNAAQRAFVEYIDPTVTPARKSELQKSMLAYCKKDTEVMVQLVDWLVSQVNTKAAA